MTGSRRYSPQPGWPFARMGTMRSVPRRCASTAVKNLWAASVPRYSNGAGGILTHTSSVIERDELVDVELGERRDKALEQLSLLSSTRCGRRGTGSPAVRHRGTSPLQRAGDRFGRQPEQVARFGGAVPEHIAQQQHSPLVGGQQLNRSDEGQRYRLARLVPGFGSWALVRCSLEQDIGVRLQPEHLAQASGFRWRHRQGRGLHRSTLRGTQMVQAPVGRHSVQPRPHRGAALETLHAQPGGEQGLLHHVLRVLERTKHPVAVHLQLTTVRLDQLGERVTVPRLRPHEKF